MTKHLIVSFAALGLAMPAMAGGHKAEICHVTKGASNPLLLSVARPSLGGHFGHGDYEPYTVFADMDSDGYGDPDAALEGVCTTPAGYVEDATDCDDTDAFVNPGIDEILGDGIDNDCDVATVDDGCVDVLLHCNPTSTVLETVCASDGEAFLAPGTVVRASYLLLDPEVTEALLVNTSGDAWIIDADTNLCSNGGPYGAWNDELVSVTVFVD